MVRIISAGIAAGLLMLALFSFRKEDNTEAPHLKGWPVLPATPYNYLTTYPKHIQASLNVNDNTLPDNPITNDGVALGRVLFYDKNLSLTRAVSCATCHQQKNSFDDDLPLSQGVLADVNTERNSMPLLNLRFYQSGKMFWRENSPTLEKQVFKPFTMPGEMGLTLDTLETRVRSLPYYPELFRKAFGSTRIDTNLIGRALAQFERTIVTCNSKYDRVKQGREHFTADEARGEKAFSTAQAAGKAACAGCHAPPMFLTSKPAGTFAFPVEAGIQGEPRFKSGSLRNISTRKFLFHKGTIPDVSSLLNAGTAGNSLKAVPQHSVPAEDIPLLLAFLRTLSDDSVTVDLRFSDPFGH